MAHYFSPGKATADDSISQSWNRRHPGGHEKRLVGPISLLSPTITRHVSHDVVRMLDAEIGMRDAMRLEDQQRLEALQSAVDACQDALRGREQELEDIQRALQERIAQETLNVHYEFEERIQSRDATIDAQHNTIGRLEAMLAQSRSHLVETGCQAGDAATVTPSEREQLLEQRDFQKQQFEALLATERSTLSMQRQHWDELFHTKLQIERDAALGTVEKERQRWMGELKRLEVAVQDAERRVDERESSLAELRKLHETAEQSWAKEREQAQRASESMALLRKQLEGRLQDVMENHKVERNELQVEFERAIKAEENMHAQLMEEERGHRQRVEEELRLLRSDRNRAIGDHRAEMKAQEAILVQTQLALTKQVERCTELEENYSGAQRALGERDRDVKEKCLKWEEMVVEATKQRAAAQLRVTALEEKLAVANLEAKKSVEIASAACEHKVDAALIKHQQEIEDLELRHRKALDAQKAKLQAEQALCLRAVEEQWKDSMARVKELEALLQRQEGERRTLQDALLEAKGALSIAETTLQEERGQHAAALQQRQAVSRSEDKETLNLREQLMKMNHTVWSLQSQLHQSQQDVSFLEGTVERMRGREHSPREATGAAARQDASPLRPDEKSEVEALFSYFHR